MNVYILKILVYLQILFDVNLNLIKQFDFHEEFDEVGEQISKIYWQGQHL